MSFFRLVWFGLWFTVGSLGAAGAEPAGTVILVGGGETPAAAVRAFIAAAGGEESPIVILAQTSEEAAIQGPRSLEMFQELGAKRAAVPAAGADGKAVCALLAAARGVWIPGGDQNRFMRAFPESSGVPAAIRGVWRRGGAVGGTSAGASLMGGLMPTGDAPAEEGLKSGGCPVTAGLSLLPKWIVDQHFLTRNRTQRLLTAVLEHPDYGGIGVEQGSWAAIHNGKITVGGGQVVLLRVKGKVRRDGATLGASEVSLRVLLAGDGISVAP